MERIGYDPVPGEELTVSSLRSAALWSAAQFGSRKAVDFSLAHFGRMIRTGEKIHADIADSVQRIAAFTDESSLARLIQRFEATDSEEERMTLATALGCVPEQNMQKSVDFALDKMPPALKFVPLLVMSGNPALSAQLWTMFKRNRERLEKLHSSHFERILVGIISIGGLFEERQVREFFSSYAPDRMKSYQRHLRETMEMALEILEANLKLRKNV